MFLPKRFICNDAVADLKDWVLRHTIALSPLRRSSQEDGGLRKMMSLLSCQPESHNVKQHTCTKMSNPRYNNEVRIYGIFNDFWFYGLNSLWIVDAMKCWESWSDICLVYAIVLAIWRTLAVCIHDEWFSASLYCLSREAWTEMRVISNYVSVIHQQSKLRSNALFLHKQHYTS